MLSIGPASSTTNIKTARKMPYNVVDFATGKIRDEIVGAERETSPPEPEQMEVDEERFFDARQTPSDSVPPPCATSHASDERPALEFGLLRIKDHPRHEQEQSVDEVESEDLPSTLPEDVKQQVANIVAGCLKSRVSCEEMRRRVQDVCERMSEPHRVDTEGPLLEYAHSLIYDSQRQKISVMSIREKLSFSLTQECARNALAALKIIEAREEFVLGALPSDAEEAKRTMEDIAGLGNLPKEIEDELDRLWKSRQRANGEPETGWRKPQSQVD